LAAAGSAAGLAATGLAAAGLAAAGLAAAADKLIFFTPFLNSCCDDIYSSSSEYIYNHIGIIIVIHN